MTTATEPKPTIGLPHEAWQDFGLWLKALTQGLDIICKRHGLHLAACVFTDEQLIDLSTMAEGTEYETFFVTACDAAMKRGES
jgi:hypothetical protein